MDVGSTLFSKFEQAFKDMVVYDEGELDELEEGWDEDDDDIEDAEVVEDEDE